jgi:hypothetical protein
MVGIQRPKLVPISRRVLRRKRDEMDLDILHTNANTFNRRGEVGNFLLVCRPARMPEEKSVTIDILESESFVPLRSLDRRRKISR